MSTLFLVVRESNDRFFSAKGDLCVVIFIFHFLFLFRCVFHSDASVFYRVFVFGVVLAKRVQRLNPFRVRATPFRVFKTAASAAPIRIDDSGVALNTLSWRQSWLLVWANYNLPPSRVFLG